MKKMYFLKKLSNLMVLSMFCLLLVGCDEDVVSNVWNGPANLTITNVTTGESKQNTATYIINLGESPSDIVFKHGDVLQLKFTPPEGYNKKSFSVDFQVLDKTATITSSPYVFEITIDNDVPVGSYIVYCSAMCKEWSEGSSCKQSIRFRVEN